MQELRTICSSVNVSVLRGSCTDFLPGARHAHAVFHGDLGHRVGAWSGVLSKAEVIIGAQVNHAAHHLTRVPAEGEREKSGDMIKDCLSWLNNNEYKVFSNGVCCLIP